MKSKTKEKEFQHSQDSECNHYWVIEVANGPTSVGCCKYCGETREFYNAFPDFNPLRRHGNPLKLPRMKDVDVREESKS